MTTRDLSLRAVFLAASFVTPFALAQSHGASFPDTPSNHWAYQAVRELADKGLVKGYKDAKSLPSKELTRYEFASILGRVFETLDDMVATRAPATRRDVDPPRPSALSQDTLNEIQALKDAFAEQLAAIQADVKKTQEDIDSLRADVSDAKDAANKALKQSDNSYGAGSGRKFSISGYIQTRFIAASSRNSTLFPNGVAPSSSPYNGNYMEGGNADAFVVRRSRVKFSGSVSPNTKYAVQLDASGLTSGSNQAVTVREGNVAYTPGDGSARFPTFTVGLFANPFGYILPQSSASIIYPDRPLAFNETSAGLFANQDYDRGVQVSYGANQFRYTAALVNGSGVGVNDTDGRLDSILRVAYASKDNAWGAGASYYDGNISYQGTPPITSRRKQLLGFDAHYQPASGGLIAMAEYVSGTFEQRTWMDVPAVKLTTAGAPGNKVSGYYAALGYTFAGMSAHPWTLAVSYDILRRSESGMPDSGSSWDDENVGFGAIYNLDAATRLRLWYTSPSKVAHPAAAPEPKKFGLFTAELQVKF